MLVCNFCPFVFLALSKSYLLYCLFTIYSAVPFKNLFTLSSRCCNFANHINRVIHGVVTQVTNCDIPSVQDLNMHPAITARGLRTSFGTNVYHVICIRFLSKLSFYAAPPPTVPFLFVFIDFSNLIYFWILDLIWSRSNNKYVRSSWLCVCLCLSHIIEHLSLITQSTCAVVTFRSSAFCPEWDFMGFVSFQRSKPIVCLRNIHWLLVVMEKFCFVRHA